VVGKVVGRIFGGGTTLLTEFEIKNAKEGTHLDGNGLYLQVTKNGAKSWLYRYQLHGKRRWAGVGALADVPAKTARIKAAEMRISVANGIDPIDQKQANKKAAIANAAKEAAKSITFRSLAFDYIEQNKAGWKNSKHIKQWENTLDTYAYGVIGHLPPAEITTDHIFTILKDIWLTKTETATRLRGRLEVILSYAKIKGYRDGENPAAWKNHLSHILPQPGKVAPHKHHAALPYQRIAKFMAALDKLDTIASSCLLFTILAACRSQESMECQWNEFDLDEKVWVVPPKRMKMKKEHRVPLTDAMLRILKTRLATKINDYVFPGVKENKPLSNMAMTNTIRRMHESLCKAEIEAGKKPKGWADKEGRIITVHGFRSSFRDWAAELTHYPGEMAELQLAHAVANPVEAAYRRGDMFEKRRAMMTDWAQWCGQKATGNVIALGKVA
jgi:integrase